MRLLYLGDTRSPHFRAWPRHFLAAGHDVHVCHVGRDAAEVFAGPQWHVPARAISCGLRGVWRVSALEVRSLARRISPDVVHSHLILPTGYLAELARVRPHVATAWGSEVLIDPSGRQQRLIARVATGAELLTADSRHLLDALRVYGADESRLRFVPWGVDREWARRARGVSREDAATRVGLPRDRRIVLAPRGSRRIFRPDLIVRAAALVRAEVPDVLVVIIVDTTHDAWPLDELASLVDDLRIADAVIFRPKIAHDEVAFLFRAAAVCVSYAESDSAPTSVLEALAVGVPVVVSDLPWVHEPDYHEARLAVVSDASVETLAGALVAAVLAPEPEDVEANRSLVARRFDREVLFGSVGDEYERLAGDRRPKTHARRSA